MSTEYRASTRSREQKIDSAEKAFFQANEKYVESIAAIITAFELEDYLDDTLDAQKTKAISLDFMRDAYTIGVSTSQTFHWAGETFFNMDDVKAWFDKYEDAIILDEYGREVSLDDFAKIVVSK